MGQARRLSWIFSFDEHVEDESVEVPEDLTGIDDPDLETLHRTLLTTFNALRANKLSEDSVTELRTVAAAINRVQSEIQTRATRSAELADEVETLAAGLQLSDLEPEMPEPESDDGDDVEDEGGDDPEDAVITPEVVTAAAATITLAPEAVTPTFPERRGTLSIPVRGRKLNVPLSEVKRRAPEPGLNTRDEAMVLVAPDVPNYPAGQRLDMFADLADAAHRRAKTLGNPSGQVTVATIKREFDIVLDRDAAPEAIWDIMRKAADPEHLVAAGGWCAPSTIIYDFFNIACDDGMLDLPTVGVTRGGIRFPQSPSIASVLADIWLWTEANDIAATGGAGPTKPCARVPCPQFDEERLDCHGLCVTAGNLTESAFPELIANHLRLTMSAHRHVMNQRFIADLVSLSTAVSVTGADLPTTSGLLGAVELQAIDYREKFRMCDTDVLEVVLPRWAKGAMRSDLAKRTGVDLLSVTDGMLAAFFDIRGVRVQYVTDWQIGSGDLPGQSTPRTNWPSLVQFLIYAAGTFVLGNGLDLDLGVVRDSTLNARNDHTAAWTEECHLIARIGHESRVVTVDHCPSGMTGAATIACAATGP